MNIKRPYRRSLIASILLAAVVSTPTVRADAIIKSAHEVVISGHPEATKLGMAVLDNGGNAIDALVTVSLALGFAEPGNSGLGGKICMEYYDASTGKVITLMGMDQSIDKLDVAATKTLSEEQITRGFTGACTPGLGAVLEVAHRKWGTKPWASLITPVADLADKGITLSPLAAKMDAQFPPKYQAEAAAIFNPGGKKLQAGDVFRNPDLANTYRLYAEQGAKAIYGGPIGEKLVAAFNAAGVPMTMEDLTAYQPRFLEPVTGTYHGLTFYSSPPPVGGGSTLVTTLAVLDQDGWGDATARDAKYVDRLCRIWQQTMPAVNAAVGDVPDSAERVAKLLTEDRVVEMAKRSLSGTPASPTGAATRASTRTTAPANSGPGPDAMLEPQPSVLDDQPAASTTHLIIIDAKGDIVCETQSLGEHFGSGVLAPGTGFLLNSDMANFSAGVNAVGPHKWPRSTISPTIIMKDNQPFMVIGTPAGGRIPTTLAQVMLDVIDFHRPLEEAIRAPRFHLPHASSKTDAVNGIDCETGFDAHVMEQLAAMGWAPHSRSNDDFYFGSVNAVMWLAPHKMTAVADTRRTYDAGGD